MRKLPETIYARREDDYLLANEAMPDAMSDDGPTVVGVYQLVQELKATKRVDFEILRTLAPKSTSSLNRK